MSEQEKVNSAFDTITGYVKNMLGIKNEVTPEQEPEVVEPQEEVEAPQTEEVAIEAAPQEEIQEQEIEVQEVETPLVEPEAEDAEAPQEPSAEVEAEIEPSVESEPAAEDEPVVEPQIEEPIVEPEAEPEIEPSVEVEDTALVPEVTASIDMVAQIADLKAQLEEKAILLAKADLSKEVENKFKGVPGKLEDKVDTIYSIKNSALKETEKEFILSALSNLSEQNLRDCEPVGADGQEEPIGEDDIIAQAKKLSEKEDITENQAVAVIKGGLKLKDIKKNKK